MKKIALIAFAVLSSAATMADAQVHVNGYYRRDGTYVQGHTRSNPDAYRYNNYGSQTNGGYQRDEYSSRGGATNRRNPAYGSYDNDGDGLPNSIDSSP